MKNIALRLFTLRLLTLTSAGLLAGGKVDTVDSVLADEAIKIKRLQDIIDYCEERHYVLGSDYIERCEKHVDESEALKLKYEDDRKALSDKFAKQLKDIDVESDSVTTELSKAKAALARYN